MRFVAPGIGRVGRGFVTDEIVPQTGIHMPDLIRLVAERYSFGIRAELADIAKAGATFEQGRLISGNKKLNIQNLAIHSDGIWVTAADTQSAEFILDDVITWAWEAFGFREPITPPVPVFESHVIVEFERSIESALKIFDDLKEAFEAALRNTYERDIPVHLSRIGVGGDPLSVSYPLKSEFVIERRIGRPFSENRYFSLAPLPTPAHIALLERLEQSALA